MATVKERLIQTGAKYEIDGHPVGHEDFWSKNPDQLKEQQCKFCNGVFLCSDPYKVPRCLCCGADWEGKKLGEK